MGDPKEPKQDEPGGEEDWSLPDPSLEAPEFIELERGADDEGTIQER